MNVKYKASIASTIHAGVRPELKSAARYYAESVNNMAVTVGAFGAVKATLLEEIRKDFPDKIVKHIDIDTTYTMTNRESYVLNVYLFGGGTLAIVC